MRRDDIGRNTLEDASCGADELVYVKAKKVQKQRDPRFLAKQAQRQLRASTGAGTGEDVTTVGADPEKVQQYYAEYHPYNDQRKDQPKRTVQTVAVPKLEFQKVAKSPKESRKPLVKPHKAKLKFMAVAAAEQEKAARRKALAAAKGNLQTKAVNGGKPAASPRPE